MTSVLTSFEGVNLRIACEHVHLRFDIEMRPCTSLLGDHQTESENEGCPEDGGNGCLHDDERMYR